MINSLCIPAAFLMLAAVATAAPFVTSLSPTRGLASEATSVVITRQQFGVSPSVTFNGVAATVTISTVTISTVTISTATSLTVSKPIDSGGDLAVLVVASGQSSNSKIFRSVALTSLPGYSVDLLAEVVVPAPVGRYSDQANLTAAIPQIKLTAYSLGAGTAQSVSFETLASQNYGIFYTASLQDGILLETVAATSGVVTRAFDPLVSTTNKRFYIVAPVR